jgi:hypothetical protein
VGSLEHMRLVERFTRVGPDRLQYEVVISDPTMWTKPWSATLFWEGSKDQIYEYACHEGNEAMYGTLNGTRVQEKKALMNKQKSTGGSR